MSQPTEPTEQMHLRAQSDLPGIALGEAAAPGIAEHVLHCPSCRREVDRYRQLIDLARDGARDDALTPPNESVWDAVAASTREPVPETPRAVPVRRWRRAVLAGAAVLALGGAGAIGWAIGDRSGSSAELSSRAALAAQPGTSSNVHGTARMHSSADGLTMTVTSSGLPAPDGYYEVWLYNPSTSRMVAIGTLGPGGEGTFTLPAGIDTAAYHVVDVSAQHYDGNNRHERSVLRGPLMQ